MIGLHAPDSLTPNAAMMRRSAYWNGERLLTEQPFVRYDTHARQDAGLHTHPAHLFSDDAESPVRGHDRLGSRGCMVP